VVFTLAAGLAPPAVAGGPGDLTEAFNNTIVSTYANGDQARLWLDRDGGYRGEGRHRDLSSGHWLLKDGKLCLRQARPVPIPFAFCSGLVSGGVGTVWKARSVFGEPLSLELTAGR
jgi:hypothetical protein